MRLVILILKITPSGSVSTLINSGLNAPRGLAFDKKGNLFCANVEWLNDFKKLLGTFKLCQTKLQKNQEYHYYTTM